MSKLNKILRNPKKIIIALLKFIGVIIPDRIYLQLMFRLMLGEKLNLKNPKTFNEKLQWLKLYNRKPEYTTMVDKYAVKEYVAKKIGTEYIIPTLGVWNKADDIDWEKLPNQFVLKTTHGGGGCDVIICKDKSTFDREAAIKKLNNSLKSDIYRIYREWPYKDVPKCIIAEKFMTETGSGDLKDYKFFCFNGKVKVLKIDFDRFVEHKANYYDKTFKLLPFGEVVCPPDYNVVIEKPENFEKMLQLVEILSKNIPFARVDLYNSNGKIYFGEITFFPASGFGEFIPEYWDEKLGDWLKLV